MILGGGANDQRTNGPGAGVAAARRVATYVYGARAQPRTIAAQQGAIDAYIAEHREWVTVAAYIDSGSDWPGLHGALDAARRGGLDVLVVHRLDRLCRCTADLATILSALDSAAVGLVDVAESYDRTNPIGQTNPAGRCDPAHERTWRPPPPHSHHGTVAVPAPHLN